MIVCELLPGDPRFVEAYNVLLEALVQVQLAHPGLRARIEPEALDADDWLNRCVRRVVDLRRDDADPRARAVIGRWRYDERNHHLHYTVVVVRTDGTHEGPDGAPMPPPQPGARLVVAPKLVAL